MEVLSKRRANRDRLLALREEYEQALRDKQERLLELRDECLQLRHQLERYQGMESQIAAALVDAKTQASQIIQAARIQAQQEADALARKSEDQYQLAQKKLQALEDQAKEKARILDALLDQARMIAGDFIHETQPLVQGLHALPSKDRSA